MPLSDAQKKHLKTLGHQLKPVVMVGQHGLKPSLLEEIDKALDYHQLLKIKISVGDRDARDRLLEDILEHASQATLIQKIGHTALLYQQNPKRPDLFSASRS